MSTLASTEPRPHSPEPRFPPQPSYPAPSGALAEPPMVYVSEKVRWEYKLLVRDAGQEEQPSERELNELGAAGWELTGVLSQADSVRLFFKRLRT